MEFLDLRRVAAESILTRSHGRRCWTGNLSSAGFLKCQEMARNEKEPKVELPELACLSKQDAVTQRPEREGIFKTIFSIS